MKPIKILIVDDEEDFKISVLSIVAQQESTD